MKSSILLAWFALFATPLCFAEAEPVHGLQLAKAPVNYSDMESIKRGAKFFAGNCTSCHTMAYLRYDPVAKEAGILADKAPISLNGVVPPDLSLEADVRGEDWIYTYLHSFYKDTNSPSGVNNLIFPGTAMPAVMAPFQGEQVLIENPTYDILHEVEWYDLIKPVTQGSMKPEEFDQTMVDVVNFLAYAAQPFRAEQHKIGYWVLGFLAVLFVLMFFLKKEYWRDVKKMKDEE
jgi:ubiquinol-cytochrome c reductase cytochrome c1 subunit